MNRSLPPLNALRAFEAAARHESFSLAAEELHVTHGAISHQIKALETWLKTPLFRRLTRAVQLTSSGHAYLSMIESAFNQIRIGTAALTVEKQNTPLHVTTTQAFAVRWLAPRLGRLWESHPDLDLRLHEHSWLTKVDFTAAEVDVAIRIGAGHGPGIQSVPFIAGTVTPMCSPMLLREGPPERPKDLLRYKLLHAYDYRLWQDWFERFGVTDADLSHGPIFDDTNLIYAAALSGQGVGLIHTALSREETAAGQLIQPFNAEPREDMSYHILFRTAEADEPRVAKFVQWLLAMAYPDSSSPA